MGRQIKSGRAIVMIVMEWIKKITDIIMPDPEDDETKDTKDAKEAKETKKAEEPLREVAAEKKVEESKEQPAQTVQSFQAEKQSAIGGISMGRFTRTNSHVSTAEGVTSMNGIRYEAHPSEASVRPSLAVVKTPQITMKIYTPTKYDEQVKAVGQDLIKRSAVLVNFEGVDEPTQQRISDFVLGVVYTINGHVELITKKIVLYVPEGFEVESAQAAMAASLRRYN